MMSLPLPTAPPPAGGLCAAASRLSLEPGLYALKVTGGPAAAPGGTMPFILFAEAPGNPAKVAMMGAAPGSAGALVRVGDALAVQVSGGIGRFILTSYTEEGDSERLALEISRLAGAPTTLEGGAAQRPVLAVTATVDLVAHVRNRGDQAATGEGWAGCPEERLWIEAFAAMPRGAVAADAMEYRCITGAGWESPWIEAGTLCGTRGLGIPLMGFAIRLRGAAATAFECMAEGLFLSGARVGPLAGGALCRSDAISDPLIGMNIRLVARPVGGGR